MLVGLVAQVGAVDGEQVEHHVGGGSSRARSRARAADADPVLQGAELEPTGSPDSAIRRAAPGSSVRSSTARHSRPRLRPAAGSDGPAAFRSAAERRARQCAAGVDPSSVCASATARSATPDRRAARRPAPAPRSTSSGSTASRQAHLERARRRIPAPFSLLTAVRGRSPVHSAAIAGGAREHLRRSAADQLATSSGQVARACSPVEKNLS
jgi:hypothetical protein